MNFFRTTLATLALCGAVLAHEGPEHEIEDLTKRIKAEGESADLLLERAIEYNVVNKTTEAIKDLERALHLEPNSADVLRELSRTYLMTGKTNEAYDTAARGLKVAAPGPEHAGMRMLRSEIMRVRKDYPKALDDADKAILEYPEQGDWYLHRSQLHRLLGLKKERIKGVEAGIQATGSGLLQVELVEALIDGGQAAAALPIIQAELDDSRLQSAWLLRRAKARLALNKKNEAKADLEAALKELNDRVGRTAIDPLTLADRGQIQELLGNKEEAKKDYESARDKGVSDEWLRERIKVVKGEDKKDDKKKPGEKKGPAPKEEPKDGDKDKADDGSDDKKDDNDPQ